MIDEQEGVSNEIGYVNAAVCNRVIQSRIVLSRDVGTGRNRKSSTVPLKGVETSADENVIVQFACHEEWLDRICSVNLRLQ